MSGLDASSNSQLTFFIVVLLLLHCIWLPYCTWLHTIFGCYTAPGCHTVFGCHTAPSCYTALGYHTVTLFPPISPCLPFLPRDWLLVIFCCYTAPGYHTVFGCYTAPSVATLHLIATLYFVGGIAIFS